MVSDCILFKPLHRNNRNAEAHRIAELEEARGQLLRIFEAEGSAVAAFEWGAISLPLELRERLTPLVGREIAILKLESRYYVREVVEGAWRAANSPRAGRDPCSWIIYRIENSRATPHKAT